MTTREIHDAMRQRSVENFDCNKNEEGGMNAGTICDIDPQEGFGLIDADDGHLVCFRRGNAEVQSSADLRVGTPVAFVVDRLSNDGYVACVQPNRRLVPVKPLSKATM